MKSFGASLEPRTLRDEADGAIPADAVLRAVVSHDPQRRGRPVLVAQAPDRDPEGLQRLGQLGVNLPTEGVVGRLVDESTLLKAPAKRAGQHVLGRVLGDGTLRVNVDLHANLAVVFMSGRGEGFEPVLFRSTACRPSSASSRASSCQRRARAASPRRDDPSPRPPPNPDVAPWGRPSQRLTLPADAYTGGEDGRA